MKNLMMLLMSVVLMTTFVSCEKSANSPYVGSYECVATRGCCLDEYCTVDISGGQGNTLEVHMEGIEVPKTDFVLDDSLNVVPCTNCYGRDGLVLSGNLTTLNGKLKLTLKVKESSTTSSYTIKVAEQ